jgi:hypothetical protein
MATTGAYNTQKIEIGAGNLQITPISDAGVALTTFEVGGTLGAELSVTQEVLDVEVDQAFAPVIGFLTGEEGTFKITVLEQQMSTIAVALGLIPDTEIYSQPTYERVTFGGKGKTRFCSLYYEVAKTYTSGTTFATAGKWKLTIFRCRATSGLALPFAKKEVRKFDLTFKIYADSTRSNALGQLDRDLT